MRTIDIAWLAGIVEGEGCMGMSSQRAGKGGTPRITIAMTDQDIVQRVAALFGRPVYGPYRYDSSKQIKPVFHTMVTGGDAIGWMFTLFSFLGERRRQKIEEVVGTWKAAQTRRRPWQIAQLIEKT